MTDLQEQIDEARAEMVFREEQLHSLSDPMIVEAHNPGPVMFEMMSEQYDAARDRYLALLAEARLLTLAESR